MGKEEIENGRINKAFLGFEDHGIFTLVLDLRFGATGQGFGMMELDRWDEKLERRIGHAFGIGFITTLLKTLKLTEFNELEGTYIRAKRVDHKIVAIGHIVEDQWFNPEELWHDYE